jgi:hypothetical protein
MPEDVACNAVDVVGGASCNGGIVLGTGWSLDSAVGSTVGAVDVGAALGRKRVVGAMVGLVDVGAGVVPAPQTGASKSVQKGVLSSTCVAVMYRLTKRHCKPSLACW